MQLVNVEEVLKVQDSLTRFSLVHEVLSNSYDELVGDRRRQAALITQLSEQLKIQTGDNQVLQSQNRNLQGEKESLEESVSKLKNELDAALAKLQKATPKRKKKIGV